MINQQGMAASTRYSKSLMRQGETMDGRNTSLHRDIENVGGRIVEDVKKSKDGRVIDINNLLEQ